LRDPIHSNIFQKFGSAFVEKYPPPLQLFLTSNFYIFTFFSQAYISFLTLTLHIQNFSDFYVLFQNQNKFHPVDFFNSESIEVDSTSAVTALHPDFPGNNFFNKSSLLIHDNKGPESLKEFQISLVIPLLFFTVVLLYYPLKATWEAWNFHLARDPSSPLSHLPLPPGEFGFPIIGETLQWIMQVSYPSR